MLAYASLYSCNSNPCRRRLHKVKYFCICILILLGLGHEILLCNLYLIEPSCYRPSFRLQRHMCPRRNGQIFNTLPGVKTGAPLGILDIKLVQARDLRHSEKTPDPFAMLYIHATPGQIRKSTTIVRSM